MDQAYKRTEIQKTCRLSPAGGIRKQPHLWVAVGVKDGAPVGAHMVATDSRRASVLDEYLSYVPRIGVTDGYPGYEKFFGKNR